MTGTMVEPSEDETTDLPDPDDAIGDELEPDTELEPDDDEQPGGEEQPETEDAAQPVEFWPEADAKSEKENARHEKRVTEIYGDASQEFEQCPMCLLGPAGWLTVKEFEPEHASLILAKLGMRDPTALEPMRGAVVCDTCKGRGEVKTPSLVPGYQTLMCPDCVQVDASGRQFATGWRYVPGPSDPPRSEYAPVQVTATDLVAGQVVGAGAEPGTTVIEQPPYDAWSRPLGHPHYNIPPADVGV